MAKNITPMKWEDLLRPFRIQRNKEVKEDKLDEGRSPFQKDLDKIIFSNSFRRLGRKTQVHPLNENDHIHTRLSHSLETSSVGRSMGNRLGYLIKKAKHVDLLPSSVGEVVQAACLAHDIGNPPFGHAGEDAIKEWFKEHAGDEIISKMKSICKSDFTRFDGNAMGFRILTNTEYDTGEGGMRLSFPTLAAMMKYPWSSLRSEDDDIGKEKFSCFQPEIDTMNLICSKLNINKKGDNHWCRHPLSYLVEAADDICYLLLDLEDARELRIISLKNLQEDLFDKFHEHSALYKDYTGKNISDRRKLAFIRGITIEKLIISATQAFIDNYEHIMSGEFSETLTSQCDDECKCLLRDARNICQERVYQHHRKIELEIGSYTAIGAMLNAFFSAAKNIQSAQNEKDLTMKTKRVIDLLGVNAPNIGSQTELTLLKFLDYLGGMTDHFATHISSQFLGRGKTDILR